MRSLKHERDATDEEVLEWLCAGRPYQPDYASSWENPEGQFTTARCFEALARLYRKDMLDRLRAGGYR